MITAGSAGLLLALVLFFAAAPIALASRRAAYATLAGASLVWVGVSLLALLHGPFTPLSYTGPFGEPEGLGLDALSGFFGLVAGLVWAGVSVYSLEYDDRPGPGLAMGFALTLGSIALLLASSSFVLFLAAWEGMTLASFWMILEAAGPAERVRSAGFVFLAFGEGSTLLLALAAAGLYAGSGSFSLLHSSAGPYASLVFLAALVGFGLKMGIAPFHMSEWLPIAHSSAPSNASAVLSATLTLAGTYGLFRVLSLLPVGPSWWGALVLSVGAVSALLGALFASVSEHLKGLPAYSTIENNGLILVALGVALIARTSGLTELFTFALFAALFQALVHAVAKGALFLLSGYLEHRSRTFDLNRVDGRGKSGDPAAFGGGLVAALSFAAAPPLAGFVSEWMILEALFQSYRFPGPELEFLGLLAGAAVALSAGLALIAMTKLAGFGLLWNPRARLSPRRPSGLGAAIAALAALVVGFGIFAPWILGFLRPAAENFAHASLAAPVGQLLSLPAGWSILSGSPFGILSPPALPLALGLGVLAAIAYWAMGGSSRYRRVPLWSTGQPGGIPGTTYSAFAYSTGIRLMLSSLLGTREVRRRAGGRLSAEIATPEVYDVELEVLDLFKFVYDALARAGLVFSDALKELIMPGRPGRYLAYILLVTLGVLVYLALVF
jgi:formate hydrogenlyase subunit 3/multisubunit Na+/H+ antiporter MnhD subunit